MDTNDVDTPPFWLQPPATNIIRRRSSSPIIKPVVLIVLIPIIALLFIFFLLPPFLTHTSQILRPNSVKKGWDSLNIVLVLFAILCGVLGRRNDDEPVTDNVPENNPVGSGIDKMVHDDDRITSSRWFDEISDRKVYDHYPGRVSGNGGGFRSSSSYPDLRQEASLWDNTGNSRFRSFDDSDLHVNRSPAPESAFGGARRRDVKVEDSSVKVIPVDTFEVRQVQLSPPPVKWPEPPPPPAQVKLKRRRSSVRIDANKEKIMKRRSENEFAEKRSPPPGPPATPPPPPPPPPPRAQPAVVTNHGKYEKVEQKKSGATKDITTAIASFYNHTKKKKKQKARNIYENATTSPPSTHSMMPPPSPPPPPPPPPHSVFHSLFKKGTKSKRIHSLSVSAVHPPPPPPPPNSIFNNIFKNNGKSKRFDSSSSSPPPPPPPPPPSSSILNNFFKTGSSSKRFSNNSKGKPPLPTKSNTYYYYDNNNNNPNHSVNSSVWGKPDIHSITPKNTETLYSETLEKANNVSNNGSQSPFNPIPPPPPLRMRELRFGPRRDFARINSTRTSRCSSPELEDVEVDVKSTAESTSGVDDGVNPGGSAFCPSPDVNMKADTFIARLRDEWRLEKINSIRAKQL